MAQLLRVPFWKQWLYRGIHPATVYMALHLLPCEKLTYFVHPVEGICLLTTGLHHLIALLGEQLLAQSYVMLNILVSCICFEVMTCSRLFAATMLSATSKLHAV